MGFATGPLAPAQQQSDRSHDRRQLPTSEAQSSVETSVRAGAGAIHLTSMVLTAGWLRGN
ncbi:hypothetical protein VW23_006485 [Devosia insulae DS-56]|uniref:Uncharacterized protein n=1 Tax=Devosia insulae DS-56 TaxID=1116389 RepID=A0A1E5XHG8_9HYPH|nr:hypothetical protein [Devosia insulae]OEO28039.1 hypothetical protein VW23_006485 [Devosia insulae DS-56]